MFSPRRMSLATALEAVEFQDRSFGDQLTKLIATIYEKLTNGDCTSETLAREPEIKLMEDLILRAKGLRVHIVANSELAAILPFYPNKSSIFIDDFFHGQFTIAHQEKVLKEANGKKGTIDLKKAKVGGFFSEGTSILYMNFYVLKTTFGMTPAEVTACTLHELGHAFSSLEYSDRLVRTNQVLAEASREIFNKKGKANIDYVFRELQKVNSEVTIEEVDKIANGNRIIGGVLWNKILIETVGQEMRNSKYSENSFEQLSDNFASRHGYGKELISALDKLHLTTGSVEKYSFLRKFSFAMSCIAMIIMPFMIFAAATTAPLIAFILTVIATSTFVGEGDGYRDNTYDELKQRYTRIRAELITFLKDPTVPKEKVATTVAQIKLMDDVISKTADYYSAWRIASNALLSKNREARRDINYQKQLEGFVNNDLFTAAAQLRTL